MTLVKQSDFIDINLITYLWKFLQTLCFLYTQPSCSVFVQYDSINLIDRGAEIPCVNQKLSFPKVGTTGEFEEKCSKMRLKLKTQEQVRINLICFFESFNLFWLLYWVRKTGKKTRFNAQMCYHKDQWYIEEIRVKFQQR